MTKKQLALAQFLHGVCHNGERFANELDPKHTRVNSLARLIDGAVRHASSAFRELTGRSAGVVTIFELNTETPAEWTKRAGREPCPQTRSE